MESQTPTPPPEMPEVIKAFIDQASPPQGQGNAHFELNWTILLMFVPYLAYLLIFLPIPYLNWGLLTYSLALVLVYCYLMSAFKEHMAYTSNPFDFVKVELLILFNVVVFFGLGYFFLSQAGGDHFNRTIQLFDGIYFSFVTIATLGYGDIHPVSSAAKAMVILEIAVGLWFFVTVIPAAVADQAERLRHFRIQRQKFAEELRKSFERGELKATEVRNDSKV